MGPMPLFSKADRKINFSVRPLSKKLCTKNASTHSLTRDVFRESLVSALRVIAGSDYQGAFVSPVRSRSRRHDEEVPGLRFLDPPPPHSCQPRTRANMTIPKVDCH